MTRVLAQATVDPIMCIGQDGAETREGWQVTVTGGREGASLWLRKQVRTYLLREPSDNLAAQEGIRRFVEELEALRE